MLYTLVYTIQVLYTSVIQNDKIYSRLKKTWQHGKVRKKYIQWCYRIDVVFQGTLGMNKAGGGVEEEDNRN